MCLKKATSGKKCKFLWNLFHKKDTNVHFNSFIFIFPKGIQRQRGVVRYITLFLGINRSANVIYHSIKIHTGVWRKQSSSEWLPWSKYVKYNQVFFSPENCGSLCSIKPKSLVATCHRKGNFSGSFLWACAHEASVKNCSHGTGQRREWQSPIHNRKEDMHLGLLSQLPIQTPVNRFHTIQASLIQESIVL